MQTQQANTVRYLLQHEIDKSKWNACLYSSDSPLLYASSRFLDGMCKHWDALVMNDYEAIMPLPWNRKWRISYIYSPYFVIAGGVFGKRVSDNTLIQFIRAIPPRFRYVDLDLNEQNFFPAALQQSGIVYKERHNTFLDLNPSYQILFGNYGTLGKRKIKKAEKQNFQLDKTGAVKKVIDLYCHHYKEKDTVVTRFDFTNMISLLTTGFTEQTQTYILSFPDGEVCAFYLLLFDANYVYWLIGGSTEKGKEAGAFYFLTNEIIKDFAGTNRIFRFEGSDHEGIRFFNKQWGGTDILYPRTMMNRLPWPLRLLK